MGADFVFTFAPLCVMNPERLAKLKAEIDRVDPSGEECEAFGFGQDDDQMVRQRLEEYFAEYPFERRDVGIMQPDEDGPRYIVTGGMSWGDEPTDSYDLIFKIGHFKNIYDLLMKWAREDTDKQRKVKNE